MYDIYGTADRSRLRLSLSPGQRSCSRMSPLPASIRKELRILLITLGDLLRVDKQYLLQSINLRHLSLPNSTDSLPCLLKEGSSSKNP